MIELNLLNAVEGWREFLYPLGYLSGIAFAGRFLLQWLTSEVQQKSVVPRTFWQCSLLGNLLLLLHALIQIQFHVGAVQACNAVIAWRNLNLMKPESEWWRLRTVILLFLAAVAMVTITFVLQGVFLLDGNIHWFQSLDTDTSGVSALWHLVGFVGVVLFSSRFWIQWWCAERKKASYLGPSFWWLSLVGGVLSVIYFVHIDDPVNAIGPSLGLLPYIRNLMLIYKSHFQKSALTVKTL